MQFASMAASIYTLVAMSLDRFLAVGYPLRTKHLRQPPAALAVVVGVWTASLLLAAPWIAVYTVREYQFPGISPFSVCRLYHEKFRVPPLKSKRTIGIPDEGGATTSAALQLRSRRAEVEDRDC